MTLSVDNWELAPGGIAGPRPTSPQGGRFAFSRGRAQPLSTFGQGR